VPLGEKVAFEAFEPPDRLVEKAPDLGDVPRDGQDLAPDSVPYRDADVRRNRGLEVGGCGRKGLDLGPRTLERRLQHRRFRPSCRSVGDALLRSFQRNCIHGREATLRAGWTRLSSITTFRRS
jgi:hypothetical protein